MVIAFNKRRPASAVYGVTNSFKRTGRSPLLLLLTRLINRQDVLFDE